MPAIQSITEKHSEEEYAQVSEEKLCMLMINYKLLAGDTMEQLDRDQTGTGC